MYLASGSFGGAAAQSYSATKNLVATGADGKLLQFDPQISANIEYSAIFSDF